MRGNVVDLAVGVIIGSAFGKIVDSLVKDVIMPPVGLLLGGVDFKFMNEAVATLKRYPHLKVEVAGHTDDRASQTHNLGLSQRRALAVMNYLMQMGIEAGRLSAKGYGGSQPIGDNATAQGRAINRRVELRILP